MTAWAEALAALSIDPEFVAETEASGAKVAYLGPTEFKEALRVEYETAVRLVKELGIGR